jgi:RNA polymerase sigma-70 factor (ECF subfamily)
MAVAAARMQGLRRLADGADGEHMTNCYRSFGAPLRAFLARHTQSVHDAEDLAQEVFLRLWRKGASDEIRSLQAFVFKTASNLLKDRGRRTYTRMMRNSTPAADIDLPDFGAEPCSVIESQETLIAFAGVLAQLRPSTRMAFLLYRLEGCSHAQIAANMGISVSMVEKHVSYSMSALRSAGFEDHGR